MPKHADFQKIYNRFLKQYGAEKGEKLYYAWVNKKGLDDTKPYSKDKKELRSCIIKGVELKELKEDFFVDGFIATSHLDGHGDIIPKETLETFAEQINSLDEAGKFGIHHSEAEENPEYFGSAEKTAKVLELADGEYGLWVSTKIEQDHPEVVKGWKNGEYNSFSITYDTDGSNTCEFEINGDNVVRYIGPNSKLFGYTGTDIPANENAKAVNFQFKELKEIKKHAKTNLKNNIKEDKMSEEKKEGKPAENADQEKKEDKEEKPEEKQETKELVKDISKEIKESLMKDIVKEIKESVSQNKPMINAGEKIEKEKKELETKELEFKEIAKEYKEKVLEGKGRKREQWKRIHEMKEFLDKNKMFDSGGMNVQDFKKINTSFEIKEIEKKGLDCFGNKVNYPDGTFSKIEFKDARFETKGVTTDTDYSGAQTTYVAALSNYEQAPARFSDIYTPYVINGLNDKTTTWNLLAKDDYSGYSSVGFRIRYGRNSTAGTPGFGSIPTYDGNERLRRCNLGFVTSKVDIQCEWESIELSQVQGGVDAYQTEIDFGINTLMNYLNGQLFGTGPGTSETAALGFEYLCSSFSSNNNLYGLNRSTYAVLDSGGETALAGAPFTLDQARTMVETVRVNGAEREDLVFIMSLRQERLFYQLVQDMQRNVPTSNKHGFTGQPELDGIPIFAEKVLDDGSKTDDIYLIDTRHTRIALKKAPTYVEMAQVSLHRRGIIWLMWQLYCTAPNHNYWVSGAETS